MRRIIYGLVVSFPLFIANSAFGQGLVCDADFDNDVDSNDLALILAARNTPASGPDDPRDPDRDGNITVLDVRQCLLQCTLPGCAEPQGNQAPSIVSTPVVNATADQLYTYDVEANDPDAGDTLTFSLDAAPAGMTIDASTGLIQWTPAAAQIGANAVTARATDAGGLFATQSLHDRRGCR